MTESELEANRGSLSNSDLRDIMLTATDYKIAIVAAIEHYERIVNAIREHRAQIAEDRCIEDDDRLYEVLGDGIKCDRRVGDKCEMLNNCINFIRNRTEEGGPWKTYKQLLEENEALFKENLVLIRRIAALENQLYGRLGKNI